MKRRVVITGMGVVSPIGNDVETLYQNALKGTNGIDHITLFDTTGMKVNIAAEVKNLAVDAYLDPKDAKRLDRAIIFGLIAAQQAYNDANLSEEVVDADTFGTFVSSGIGGLGTINEESRKAHEKGPDRMSPFFIPNSIVNLIGGHIAIKFKAKGVNLPVVTACSAATNAIGEAFRYLRDGYLDIAFAGGAEAPINELGVGGFTVMKALNFSNDKDKGSIPFDVNRSGFVIGEGAGVLILETLEHAKKRNAKIYGEIVGYGSTCDAFHMTAPDESAEGITKCIQNALKDGQVDPNQIDLCNPHGTSTPYNDKYEYLGLKNVFHDHLNNIHVSATKSMHGHALGAVGAIEAILTVKSLMHGKVIPTINVKHLDPECPAKITAQAIDADLTYAISNSVGFGGQNATLVFKKYKEAKA